MDEIIEGFDDFIADYPIYDYRIVPTDGFCAAQRVRIICREECERYGSTWACPPGVGTLSQCERRIRSYPQGVFFSSAAEVSDLLNMEELLSTRGEHESLTTKVADYLGSLGYETYTLSTESCDICDRCAYLDGEPCRHPEHMHPCLESHGVVAQLLAEEQGMDYQLGGNTILWFSLVLYRKKDSSKEV
ncbi:MAG: DUF2284 domain-containing protein [Eubacteriales bacterium]|nr:DUF2284 domain-containing protein [Eubacteriales bacterium]